MPGSISVMRIGLPSSSMRSTLGEGEQPELGRVVAGAAGVGLEAGDRADVDDVAVAARLQHRQQRLGHAQDAEHVGLVHPGASRPRRRSATGSRPSAPPALLTSRRQRGHGVDEGVDRGGVGDVEGVGGGADARPASVSSRSRRRAPITTSKPSAASRRAVAAPMPDDAPVTTATPRFMAATLTRVARRPARLGPAAVAAARRARRSALMRRRPAEALRPIVRATNAPTIHHW